MNIFKKFFTRRFLGVKYHSFKPSYTPKKNKCCGGKCRMQEARTDVYIDMNKNDKKITKTIELINGSIMIDVDVNGEILGVEILSTNVKNIKINGNSCYETNKACNYS